MMPDAGLNLVYGAATDLTADAENQRMIGCIVGQKVRRGVEPGDAARAVDWHSWPRRGRGVLGIGYCTFPCGRGW